MQRSALLTQHVESGARLLDDPDRPAVLTYGDVPAEYRAAQEAAALFDATDRGAIQVRGEERAEFLHRILANAVRGLEVGQGNRNLLLTSKGKVLFEFDLTVEEDLIELSCSPGCSGGLLQNIDRYLFAEKVELKDTTESSAPLELCGPKAADVIARALGSPAPQALHGSVRLPFAGSSVRATALPVAGSPGFRLDGGPQQAGALWKALVDAGALPTGLVARDILRIEAGQALFGTDVDEGVYPQEARLESAFSLEKGCYIGQEVVAKIDTYGGLNKRLVALRVSHDDPVPTGTRLTLADDAERRDLGVVTSWSYSFVLDTGLCLGYVKRRHQAVGTTFHLGEGEDRATIVELPVRAGSVAVTGEFE